MTQLDPEIPWNRMWEAFHEVLEAGAENRETLLSDLEPELRLQVEDLLAAHEKADAELPGTLALTDTSAAQALVGCKVGPYQVRELLGEGGMGRVYVAEQREPVRRLVALKVIKPGMDTHQVLARFEAERQALVMMNHSAIAAAYEAGATDDGRPYFAMEYVAGKPIDEFCDHHRLTLQERLELFVRVCRGVHHAHGQGVIHRDLKPSNVLVTLIDAEAMPKVIDFGIAKAMRQPLTDHTLYTQVGMLIGTPEYMSPEQADPGRSQVDPRSDVYSLGVILYRLMTGVLPFAPETLRGAGYVEVRRVLKEDEAPLASTRLSEIGEQADQAAHRRRTTRQRLVRELREELDWVAAKAMEKDPRQRYASAADMAVDVERYLSDHVVLAGPGTVGRRLKSLARRYRPQVRAAAGFAVLLLSLGLGSALLSKRPGSTDEARERALAFDPGPKSLALTLGGLPHSDQGHSLETLRDMTAKLQARLRERAVPVVGFVNERKLYEPGEVDERIAVLKSWVDMGVDLGNRTYAQTSLCEASARDFINDVVRGETVIRRLMNEAGRNLTYFHHPHVCTGRDLETRRRVEAFLAEYGYVVTPMTIENSDYLFARAYRHLLEAGDTDRAAAVAESYLEFSDAMLAFWERASEAVLGRQVRHVFMIEANRLNADHLGRLLDVIESRGYRFVSLDEALNDPAYDLPDEAVANYGLFWLYRWEPYAKEDFLWSREPIPEAWVRQAAQDGG